MHSLLSFERADLISYLLINGTVLYLLFLSPFHRFEAILTSLKNKKIFFYDKVWYL